MRVLQIPRSPCLIEKSAFYQIIILKNVFLFIKALCYNAKIIRRSKLCNTRSNCASKDQLSKDKEKKNCSFTAKKACRKSFHNRLSYLIHLVFNQRSLFFFSTETSLFVVIQKFRQECNMIFRISSIISYYSKGLLRTHKLFFSRVKFSKKPKGFHRREKECIPKFNRIHTIQCIPLKIISQQ